VVALELVAEPWMMRRISSSKKGTSRLARKEPGEEEDPKVDEEMKATKEQQRGTTDRRT